MKRVLLSLVIIFSMIWSSNAEEPKIKDLTIVVSSCDKYSALWPTFFDLLFKNWPSLKTYNKDVPILLVSNGKDFDDPRVTVIKSDQKLNWTGNVNEVFGRVKTKYVLYLQEDYFITNKVLEDQIAQVVNDMKREHLDKVTLNQQYDERNKSKMIKISGSELLKYKNHDMLYLTSLQASIWDKEIFQEFLNQKTTNIWDFEDRRASDGDKFASYTANPKPIYYVNFMNTKYIRFTAYSWLYFKGYDTSFADGYPIGGKSKIGKEIEWLRRKMPKLANIVFYVSGFFVDLSINAKIFLKPYKDKFLSAIN